jgi:hypothetical protein
MSRGLIFWVLMLIWAVFGLLVFGGLVGGVYSAAGSRLLDFILFLLLGWQVYGPPIRG